MKSVRLSKFEKFNPVVGAIWFESELILGRDYFPTVLKRRIRVCHIGFCWSIIYVCNTNVFGIMRTSADCSVVKWTDIYYSWRPAAKYDSGANIAHVPAAHTRLRSWAPNVIKTIFRFCTGAYLPQAIVGRIKGSVSSVQHIHPGRDKVVTTKIGRLFFVLILICAVHGSSKREPSTFPYEFHKRPRTRSLPFKHAIITHTYNHIQTRKQVTYRNK